MAECGCTNISIMQLFHELKQEFPALPDEVVSHCIRQNAHNKGACERALRRASSAPSASHSYPAALMTGAHAMSSEPARANSGVDRDTSSSPAPVPGSASVGKCGASRSPAAPAPAWCDTESGRPPGDLKLHINRTHVESGPIPVVSPSPPALQECNGSGDLTVVSCAPRRSPPPPPRPAARHTTAMLVQPLTPLTPMTPVTTSGQPRSYTSVNMTLRPPSSQPQPPIDIHSAGSSLTYSTSSYDPRQGYQSQLQIRIGPDGLGSVSAMRSRAPVGPHGPVYPPVPPRPIPSALPPIPSIPPDPFRKFREQVLAKAGHLDHHQQERLVRQLERRALLESELEKERNKLQTMQREVIDMERDLQRRTTQVRSYAPPALPIMEKVQRLQAEIKELQRECTRMANDVDTKAPQALPLGETDEEFYKNIYSGPSGSLWPHHSQAVPPTPSPTDSDELHELGWTCRTCTFHNHPLLEACETCEVPRHRREGRATQNIHIRFTHHNFQARRSLHGWVE